MPTLEEHNQNVAEKQAVFEKAAQELSTAKDAYTAAKVAEMDPATVQQAHELGINPENFENTEHLQGAIDIRQAEIEKENAAATVPEPAANSELPANA